MGRIDHLTRAEHTAKHLSGKGYRMSDFVEQELKELAEYRASGLTPEQVIKLAKYIRNLLKEMEDKNNG